MRRVYAFFAGSDGFGEFIVCVALFAAIVLAFIGKLSDSYAATIVSIGGLGVVHDNVAAWLERKRSITGRD
jgi:hypothetical protein